MQLAEPLLSSAASLSGAPFYPLESAGGRAAPTRHLSAGSPPSPPRLDLDKGPKKFGSGAAAAAGMLGEPEAAGETPAFAAAGQVASKAAPAAGEAARKSPPCPPEDEGLPPAPTRYTLDGLSPERYYLPSPGPPGGAAELGGPCALFPYAGAAGGAQAASMYPAAGGARYPYGSVLAPPGGFSTAPGRTPFAAAAGAYQYGQGAPPGSLYSPYPSAAGGSCGGLGALAMAGGAAGLRAQVFLCNRPLWLKFHRHQTEMIITKQGRCVGSRARLWDASGVGWGARAGGGRSASSGPLPSPSLGGRRLSFPRLLACGATAADF